jgi:putative methyltransferase (TIGR04325 family)
MRTWILRALGTDPGSTSAGAFNWEGVYSRFADVPSCGSGFEDDSWISDTRRLTEGALQERAETEKLFLVDDDSMLLPLLLATISAASRSSLKVLDFGGGMGVSYAHCIGSIIDPQGIEYHIIEKPRVCEEGRRVFPNNRQIHFHARIPETLTNLDVVYVNSALQYIEDYRALLQALCALAPRFVLLGRCSAGDVPTYATAQLTLPGKRLPYWFINVRELVAILGQRGYTPAFMARGSYLVDQSNFEPKYRIGSTCNLLFARASSA